MEALRGRAPEEELLTKIYVNSWLYSFVQKYSKESYEMQYEIPPNNACFGNLFPMGYMIWFVNKNKHVILKMASNDINNEVVKKYTDEINAILNKKCLSEDLIESRLAEESMEVISYGFSSVGITKALILVSPSSSSLNLIERSVRLFTLKLMMPHIYSGACAVYLGQKESVPPKIELSKREKEILHWISIGKTNIEIGEILGISSSTVKNHVYKIYKKLNVVNRAQAVASMEM